MDPLLAVDKAIGQGVERLVRSHHARRLRRIGWHRALEPPDPSLWASASPPPRAGCSVEVLIDGAQALPRLAEELRKARSHVHLAGWFVTPDFALVREPARVELRTLLAELAERIPVRVLLWAGSPLPLFRPDRKDVARALHALTSGTKIEAVADPKERPLHCHHEKITVIDDGVAFVGGIDLTTESGDRFDTNVHPARGELGWHDAACVLRGPAVTDVAAHFAQRWHDLTGNTLPEPSPAPPTGDVEVQIVRTVPEHVYESVRGGDFRILESYVRAFRSAQRLIYLENQFLWSSEIVQILLDKIVHPPSDDFCLVLVLPAKPNSGRDDTRGQLADLIEADDGAGRVLACTLRALGERGPCPVYVHAKIGIVDDRWLTLGSANLNEHSLFNDTEINVVTCNAELARGTRLRLWAEHLERSEQEVSADPVRVVRELWKPIAEEQYERREAGLPPTHRLCLLPGVSRRSRRLLGPLQGLLVDG
ncbi:MAG TPA: phospholipase D family protein [Gaiellaceae bacterium]|jgi:phosphatidylserine/phosphatidylglycerophosphate/cardiolipin synthase-like enzyme